MSEMLDFDYDGEEADEIAEEDLVYLKDLSTELDLVVSTGERKPALILSFSLFLTYHLLIQYSIHPPPYKRFTMLL